MLLNCVGYVSVPRSNEAKEGYLSSHPHRKLLLFSGNDYLGLSAHPTVRMAAAKVVLMVTCFPMILVLLYCPEFQHSR